jgi:hypothetical protein
MDGSDRIGSGTAGGGTRPEQSRDGEFRDGAITGERYLVIQSVTSQKKSTGME